MHFKPHIALTAAQLLLRHVGDHVATPLLAPPLHYCGYVATVLLPTFTPDTLVTARPPFCLSTGGKCTARMHAVVNFHGAIKTGSRRISWEAFNIFVTACPQRPPRLALGLRSGQSNSTAFHPDFCSSRWWTEQFYRHDKDILLGSIVRARPCTTRLPF